MHVDMIPEVNSNRFFEISNHCGNWFCSHEYLAKSACHFFKSCVAMFRNLIDGIKLH